MYSSITITNYFLRKAWSEEKDLTIMHVLKLVYIAHGWFLGLEDKPLIRERIWAWPYGPVIPELYHRIKSYGRDPITILIESPFHADNHEIVTGDVESFLENIWDTYKDFTALQLSGLTHQHGSPWDQTISDQKRGEKRATVILNSTIKKYYSDKIKSSNATT